MTPIFIIGSGRSGTRLLRSCIGSSTYVKTIPYDVGYVWRYGNEQIEHDELTVSNLTPETKKYVINTLPKLANKDSNSKSDFLVEKSVPNSLRPNYLKEIFPDAKFIHLIRDGRAVVESAMRAWEAPVKRKYLLKKLRYFPIQNYKYLLWYINNLLSKNDQQRAIWGPRYEGIQSDVNNLNLTTVCTRQWRKCVEVSLSQLSNFDSQQVFEIRYEELIEDPSRIEEICKFIGISDTNTVVQYTNELISPSYSKKWKQNLTAQNLKEIYNEAGETLSKLNYD